MSNKPIIHPSSEIEPKLYLAEIDNQIKSRSESEKANKPAHNKKDRLLIGFNKKYTNLNDEQKDILREYINNVTNTSKFGEYYDSKLKVVVTELHKLYSEVNDKITKIKLKTQR
jgi:hypothetical protein